MAAATDLPDTTQSCTVQSCTTQDTKQSCTTQSCTTRDTKKVVLCKVVTHETPHKVLQRNTVRYQQKVPHCAHRTILNTTQSKLHNNNKLNTEV